MADQRLRTSIRRRDWHNETLMVSIDLGTTYSGFAYSFYNEYIQKPKVIHCPIWVSGENLSTEKTPTCLLLKPDGSYHSFGYEAETKYSELTSHNEFEDEPSEDYRRWHYFTRFKMALHGDKTFYQRLTVNDSEGREFPAIEVFSKCIAALRDKAWKEIHDKLPGGFSRQHVYYVVTTPAIWSDMAKQFMRDAAEKAGISSDHLVIALEPECAALQCKSLEKADGSTKDCSQSLGPDSCYMVLDIGGGTTDVTVYEINRDHSLCEVCPPSGGPWGGENVNETFNQFIVKLVSATVFKRLQQEAMGDYISLQRAFELKKRVPCNEYITMSIPPTLAKFFEDDMKESFSKSVEGSSFAKSVKIAKTFTKMKIDRDVLQGFFQPTIRSILGHIDAMLKRVGRRVDTMLLVGGFSNCELLKDAIRQNFPDKHIINPADAQKVVMKGAIVFGREPSIIHSRICRHTYGIDWNEDFDPNKHPRSKRETTDDGIFCRDVFKRLAQRDSIIPYEYTPEEIETGVKYSLQEKIEFPFYMSDAYDPKFITDEGCIHIGTLTVSLPKGTSFLNQSVYLRVTIGSTEIHAEALDEYGHTHSVKFTLP